MYVYKKYTEKIKINLIKIIRIVDFEYIIEAIANI